MHYNNPLRIFSFLILLFFIYGHVSGQDKGTWVSCQGEVTVNNISMDEAQVLAKRRARLDAIEKACGIRLKAESLIKDFIMAGDFIHSISHGQVIEEKELYWYTETLPAEKMGSPPVLILRLTMNANVIPVHDKPDPYFQLKGQLNRSAFQSGEEVIIELNASKACYITIFNIASNDSVYLLFPNAYHKNQFIGAETWITLPSEADRKNGVHFRVKTLEGNEKNTEVIKIIATKDKIPFLSTEDVHQSGVIGTPKTAMTKLAMWLSSIPLSDSSEITMMITVFANEKVAVEKYPPG